MKTNNPYTCFPGNPSSPFQPVLNNKLKPIPSMSQHTYATIPHATGHLPSATQIPPIAEYLAYGGKLGTPPFLYPCIF